MSQIVSIKKLNKMENLKTQTIGKLAADDYRTAVVFQKYKIDFCCNGDRTIEEACINKKIPVEGILAELNAISNKPDNQKTDYQSWSLDLLCDYIEKKHHRYIEQTIPAIKQYLDKLCKVHGNNNPELFEIKVQFNASAGELAAHMKKEELILFPYIRKMVAAKNNHENLGQRGFGTIQNSIQMMMHEHDIEGDRFRKISSLSCNYNPPSHACNTYKITYSLLKEFEEDLHLHIHLENNILFPEVIELEKELAG